MEHKGRSPGRIVDMELPAPGLRRNSQLDESRAATGDESIPAERQPGTWYTLPLGWDLLKIT